MVPHVKIEEEIHAKLGISTEQICAVTSVPDERKGESIVVLYKGNIDLEKLCKSMSEGRLPKLWIPKKNAYFQIDEVPLLGSGKLDIKKIKAIALEKQKEKES